MTFTVRRFLSVLALGAAIAASSNARAQVGSGGTTGTVTLTDADLYVNVQRQEGVNLTDRDRALFLNRGNCQCGTTAWVKAVIQPTAVTKAAAISPSASVSMWVGNACDPTSTVSCCHRLASVPYSEFRLNGIIAKTTVDQLVREWSPSSGSCRDTINPILIGSGTGGSAATGTGGSTGTGGISGTGGAGGMGGVSGAGGDGTGGAGTGGATVTGPTAACDAPTFSQSIHLFIGTTGDGTRDAGEKTLGFSVDPQPPPQPTITSVDPVNQALQLNWTGLTTAEASDLLGYQALCTRGEFTQVFKDGTFTAAFDACPAASGNRWPGGGSLPASSFVCSDLLPASATSARLKILENDITYYVGLAAVDKQRNASFVSYLTRKPVLTKDFYYEYRNGNPQGGATGGYCAVAGATTAGRTMVGMALCGLLGLVLLRGRRRPPRRP